MKKWNILVLDLSASMTYNKSMLVKGYNTLINDQKTQGSRDKFTVIGFNTETKIIKNEFFPDVSSISNEDFVTQGCTALLDTVGYVYDIILDNSEYDDIIITVITDGMENSSKIYTYDMLNQKRKEIDKHYNIEFLFIGSDISCLQKNVVLSHVSQSINYDGEIASIGLIVRFIAVPTLAPSNENADCGLHLVGENGNLFLPPLYLAQA